MTLKELRKVLLENYSKLSKIYESLFEKIKSDSWEETDNYKFLRVEGAIATFSFIYGLMIDDSSSLFIYNAIYSDLQEEESKK